MVEIFALNTPAWLSELLYFERHVNDGSPNRLSFVNGTSPGFSPKWGTPVTAIPLIRARNAQVEALGDSVSSDLLSFCAKNHCIPVHPDVLGYYFSDGLNYEVVKYITAAPSASGRTVLVEDGKDFRWLKLSYPGRLGRFSSELGLGTVSHSLAVSSLMASSEVAFLAEFGAITIRHLESDCYSFGCVLRNVVPKFFDHSGKYRQLPLFSLLARRSDQCDQVLNFQNSTLSKDEASIEFFRKILQPILTAYWDLAIKLGVIIEAHPQNILLETNDDQTWRVVVRDCQGIIRDPGFGPPTSDAIREIASEKIFVERSRRYDDFLTQYTVVPLILRAAWLRSLNIDMLIELVRDYTSSVRPPAYFDSDLSWYEMPLEQVQYGRRIEYVKRHGRPLLR